MDIIAAHQQGLLEQIDEDVRALSGRPCDHAQRAVVLHHLFDHSRGAHQWALAEARRELRVAWALAAIRKRVDRWGWAIPNRGNAEAALDRLTVSLGKASAARCAGAYRAYRVSAAPALQGEAEAGVPVGLLEALRQCHDARRSGGTLSTEAIKNLWECSQQLATTANLEELASAWAAVEITRLRRIARRLLGERALERNMERDRKRGWGKIERELRSDPLLPAAFRANPAQHFYALQLAMVQRRRQQWREACDREPHAFELAA